jgi:hypothetical protein
MEVNLHAQAVFASPLESLENIFPTGLSQERLIAPCLDRPKRDRNPDPIQAGSGNLGKVLLGLEHDSPVLALYNRRMNSKPLTMKVW